MCLYICVEHIHKTYKSLFTYIVNKAEKTYISPLIKRERERIKRRKKDRGAENLLKERERENKKKEESEREREEKRER